jgi:hypothetical protein
MVFREFHHIQFTFTQAKHQYFLYLLRELHHDPILTIADEQESS